VLVPRHDQHVRLANMEGVMIGVTATLSFVRRGVGLSASCASLNVIKYASADCYQYPFVIASQQMPFLPMLLTRSNPKIWYFSIVRS
jgi:hypothetical protein